MSDLKCRMNSDCDAPATSMYLTCKDHDPLMAACQYAARMSMLDRRVIDLEREKAALRRVVDAAKSYCAGGSYQLKREAMMKALDELDRFEVEGVK